MKRLFAAALVAFVLVHTAGAAYAEDLKRVIVLRPDDGKNTFWPLFDSASRAACASLGCEVETITSDWNQVTMIERLEARLKREPKPDLVLFQSFKHNGPKIIELAEKYKVYAFLVNADLDEQQAATMGKPREKYKFWIGRMMPDDAVGGRLMAESLYKNAVAKGFAKDGVVTFSAIEGNHGDGASIERVKGLNVFISANGKIKLTQIVEGKWKTDVAADLAKNLMRRYPDVHVIWAAGDSTAMGVIEAAKAKGKVPGKDILTAGLDWSTEALQAVKNDEMEVSVGGHFMESAWAIVVMYDYFKGHDFAQEDGLSMHSNMAIIDKDNVDRYMQKYGSGDFTSINFKQFSKVENPSIKKYTLDFSTALK
jgi:ABC-type sugar transport system substrate-binding protein